MGIALKQRSDYKENWPAMGKGKKSRDWKLM